MNKVPANKARQIPMQVRKNPTNLGHKNASNLTTIKSVVNHSGLCACEIKESTAVEKIRLAALHGGLPVVLAQHLTGFTQRRDGFTEVEDKEASFAGSELLHRYLYGFPEKKTNKKINMNERVNLTHE